MVAVQARSNLKPIRLYSIAGRLRNKNAIYEKELVTLLQRGKVLQLVISVEPEGGYSVAVLCNFRAEEVARPYARVSDKVVRLRRVSITHEGFAPLYSVRSREPRQYRSLDTLMGNLMACGPLPPIYIRTRS